jgi:hypothetical protein
MEQLSIMNTSLSHPSSILLADPVRPHIPPVQRIAANREVFYIHDSSCDLNDYDLPSTQVKSVLCVAYIGAIPKTEEEVFSEWSSFNVACFYSVWSNERGYGRKIIQSSINHIRWNRPYITNAVTFSPKTDMAKNFHFANGAKLYRENEDSYNFEYTL